MNDLSFDWKLSLSLIKQADIDQRKKGILLLIYSHFPIMKTQYFEELRNAMAQAQDADEINAWGLFLNEFLVSKADKKAWQKFLEMLLDAPQSYGFTILAAARER